MFYEENCNGIMLSLPIYSIEDIIPLPPSYYSPGLLAPNSPSHILFPALASLDLAFQHAPSLDTSSFF